MDKAIKKAVKTGYGLGLLSLEQAKKVTAKVSKELNLNKAESTKLARELVANSEKAAKDVIKTATRYFESALVKSGAVSRGEIRSVKRRVTKRVKGVKKAVKKKVRKK